MDDLKELLTIDKCNCGREYCDFFGGGVGDNGSSFSKEEIEEMVKILPKVTAHLEKLLIEEGGKR